ncbi:MAG: O-antigen ligase family protein [Devosiaceae bacterium]|nr:O-antigen ligase family protein [Devosiaceae bacterium]
MTMLAGKPGTGEALSFSPTGAQKPTQLHFLAKAWLVPMVSIWMISGGFVIFEPSPYEFMFLLVLPVAYFAGIGIHRKTLGIFQLMVLFIPFALIGSFQVRYMSVLEGMVYSIVTVFLWFTAYFAANYIADDPQKRLGGMMGAYTGVAVFISVIGTLAYLNIIPGAEIFLRYDRVKATFQDPNVFGPFLIIPAAFALQRMLLDKGKRALFAGAIYGILLVGVFVSFSRAAWGYMIFTSGFVFIACFLFESNAKDRSRMIGITLVGLVLAVVALIGLLSIDSVRELFLQRFSLNQTYDSGSTGRFARQTYALEMALANPFGIGPLEFRNLRITEEPHNTYVKVLLTYGWIGGLAYFALVWMTFKHGFAALKKASPNRLLMIPLMANFIPIALESAIIDTDHWRHFFLLVGMIWGVSAGYGRVNDAQSTRRGRLI